MAALAKAAIGTTSFSCTASDDGWDCTNKLNEALIDPTKMEKG